KTEDINALALRLSKKENWPKNDILRQIRGYQIATKKLPSWTKISQIIFPEKKALEQCSSEITGKYKSGLLQYDSFADLSGGFGIDCKFLADKAKSGVYIEKDT